MSLIYMLPFFAVVSTPTMAASLFAETPTVAESQAGEQGIDGGRWTGSFLQKDWTIELTNQNRGWSGRYMRSDGGNWLPLQELVVSGRSVSFSIESRPKVSFSLESDAAGRNLTGTVTVDGFGTVPFSAARAP